MNQKFFISSIFAVLFLHRLAFSQAGALDFTFGGDGIVTTDFSGKIDHSYAVVIQPDGKIVAAGHSNIGTALTKNMIVTRYNSDGTLDPAFGTGGSVVIDLGTNYDDFSFAVTLQNDGKIVVAGANYDGDGYRFAIVRFETSGALDNTFGTGGILFTDFGGMDDWGRSIIITDDGKMLVGGYRNDGLKHNFAVIRCNSNGTMDDTFGSGGQVYTSFAFNRHDQAYSLGVQIDGKIVLAGYSYIGTSSDYQVALARYNTDGTLDNTFDADGMVLTDLAVVEGEAYALAIQHDNKLVVAGYSFIGADVDFLVARYNSDGSLDNTFGTAGIVNTDFGGYEDNAYAITLQADGKIVVAGDSWNGSDWDFALARYNADGSLDNTFGSGGKVTTAIGGDSDGIFGLTLQSDGKIVVSGYSYNGSQSDFALARYNGSGEIAIHSTEATAPCIIKSNPFDNAIHIELLNNGEISLSDVFGNIVWKENVFVGNTSIPSDKLPAGIYFIHFSDGATSYTAKVMKL